MFLRVLGPLEVEVDGAAVDVGGPSSRRVLAALLAAEGTPVSDSELADLVWEDGGQRDVLGGLRVMVSRLRSVLGPAGRESLRRAQSGYQLVVPVQATDHGRFTAAVSEGLGLQSAGEAATAAAVFESALRWWRGESWPELGDALVVSGARARLAELREVATDELQAARLQLGQTSTAVAALSEAVITAPYRERRWELLALGLYRGGRQAHALAELRRARRLLLEELGTQPSPALRDLEQRLLTHDPTLLRPETAPASTPPAPAPPQPTSISKPWTSLIGRTEQLRLLGELLHDHRLVTVMGPAGVGKTRLALEHAAARQPDQGETWLVRLADIHTGQDAAATIAAAVGVLRLTGDLITQVRHALVERPGLLVLDNCEHLLEPVAELSAQLLTACPDLLVLTTSRTRLGVDGEQLLPVDPLPVLDEHGNDAAAVHLLFDRIRQHRARWTPTESEQESARQICTMLDGLPLAIELAAARERTLGLPTIATELAAHLDPLLTTPRGSVNPHRSLHAAIAWSVAQLTSTDRAMLLRLWPFEGGFTRHAAHAVQPRGVDAVLATLASLIDHSVITTDTATQPARYRMLETIRRYCRDADPDPAGTEEAHAAWVHQLAAEQNALIHGPVAVQDLRVLTGELANLRAGIVHDLERNPAGALRATGQLPVLWPSIAASPEGMRLTQAALDAAPDAPLELRVDGLLALSLMTYHSGRPDEAVRLADAAIELLGEPTGEHGTLLAKALLYRASGASERGDVELLRATLNRFAAHAQRQPVPDWIRANVLLCEAALHLMQGNWDRAEITLTSGRELANRCGFLWAEGTADLILARSLLRGRTPELARAHRATSALRRALAAFQEQANSMDQLATLYTGAHALALIGPARTAVTLRAAVTEHATRVGIDLSRYARLSGTAAERRMSTLLSDPERAAAEIVGRDLSWPDMISLFTGASSRGNGQSHP